MGQVLEANQSALAYWRATGYADAAIDQLCRENEDKYYLTKIVVEPKNSLRVIASRKICQSGQGHLPACMRFFKDVSKLFNPETRGSFVLWNEDAMYEWKNWMALRVPILCFARHVTSSQAMLVPDPAFMHAYGYTEDFKKIDETEAELSWNRKIPTAFWRGAASGLGTELETEAWREAPRVRLGLKSKEVGDSAVLDAYISKVDIFSNPMHAERIRALGIMREYVPFLEMLRYRYQIDIDGISCAWLSYFLKLASQSVVLKVHSDYSQWFYHTLKPWQHYLPVSSSLDDLLEAITWARSHDQACQNIAAAGRTLVRSITYDKTVEDTAKLLQELFQYQR